MGMKLIKRAISENKISRLFIKERKIENNKDKELRILTEKIYEHYRLK